MKTSRITLYLTIYGISHALVDASCIVLILGGIDVGDKLLSYLLLYNILAFGLQLFFGWVVDHVHKPVLSTVLGCVILSAALMFYYNPLVATILAGVGNALFHTGGGTISLNLKPGKASLPGVFVAPGGIGLFVGGLILKLYGFHPEVFIILLLVMSLVISLLKSPPILYVIKKPEKVNYLVLTIVLLLITICMRSAVGMTMTFPWKSNMVLLLLLTMSIALGKGLGGFIADYFGWIKIAVGGLVLSAILLFFNAQIPWIGMTGMFLFNITMPVTLVAISNLLPGRPGFSFGLTTLALIIGSLPAFFPIKSYLSQGYVSLVLILFSAVTLYFSLKLYSKYRRSKYLII